MNMLAPEQELGVVGARQAAADVNFVVMACAGLFLKFPPVLRTFFLLWHCKCMNTIESVKRPYIHCIVSLCVIGEKITENL